MEHSWQDHASGDAKQEVMLGVTEFAKDGEMGARHLRILGMTRLEPDGPQARHSKPEAWLHGCCGLIEKVRRRLEWQGDGIEKRIQRLMRSFIFHGTPQLIRDRLMLRPPI